MAALISNLPPVGVPCGNGGGTVYYAKIEGKGNGILAARNLTKGEHLFSEIPLVWGRDMKVDKTKKVTSRTCAECGRFLVGEPTVCGNDGCIEVYCGEKCQERAFNSHHSILCCQDLGVLTAHQICAVKILAKVLLDTVKETGKPMAEIALVEIEDAFRSILGEIERLPFTRGIHYCRGGRPMPDEMFESMFEKTYFDGHLHGAYTAIRDIFVTAIGGDGGKFTEYFTEKFFDELMGMFLNNCQSVSIRSKVPGDEDLEVKGSALFTLYSKSNHACLPDWTNEPLVVMGDDQEESGDPAEYERVGVNLFISRDMKKGEEINNCYFQEGSGEGMTKSQRQKKLAQYLFKCECVMCLEEASVESDY
jgi:hypothetical protein